MLDNPHFGDVASGATSQQDWSNSIATSLVAQRISPALRLTSVNTGHR